MDVVTHMTAGALCAELGHRRKIGKKAYVFGALFALFPDLDLFFRFLLPSHLSLLAHRSLTHSLILLPVFSALLAYGVLFFYRKKRKEIFDFLPLWQLSTLSILIHILFDYFNNYGTYLFWPLNFKRYYLDLLPLVDPLFTTGLILVFVLTLKKELKRSFVFFLSWTCLYLSFLGLQHHLAKKEQEKIILGRGEAIEKERVFPLSGNPFLWRSLYRTADKLYVDNVCLIPFFYPKITVGRSFYLAKEKHLLTSYLNQDQIQKSFRSFESLSDGFVAFVPSRLAHIQTVGDFRNYKTFDQDSTKTRMEFDKNSPTSPVKVKRSLR